MDDLFEEVKSFSHGEGKHKKLGLKALKNPKLLFAIGVVFVVILVLLKGKGNDPEYGVATAYDGYPEAPQEESLVGGSGGTDIEGMLTDFQDQQNQILNDMFSSIVDSNNTAMQNLSDNNDLKFSAFETQVEKAQDTLYQQISGLTDPRLTELSSMYAESRTNLDALGMLSANREANSIRDARGESHQNALGDIKGVADKQLANLSTDYNLARSKGDADSMQKANSTANAIRSALGLPTQDASGDIASVRNKGTSSGSSKSSSSSSSSSSSGGRTLTATSDGKAPSNAKVGDTIKTAGGDFKITGGSSGKWTSQKVG